MKKIIVYVTLAFSTIFLTTECQKSKMNPEKISENSTDYDFRKDNSFIETFTTNEKRISVKSGDRLETNELKTIAKISDEDVRRTTYGLLNASEKVNFWNYVITTNIRNGNFTESQTQLLKDVQNAIIKPNVFGDKNLQQILGANFLPLIADQLEKAGISQEKMNFVFSSGTILNTITPGGQLPNCNCNAGSRFSCNSCQRTDDCFQLTDCGFGWLFVCNGLCGRNILAS